MKRLLDLQGAGTLENLCVGAGDLYVTVYCGRTRLVGILLGRGLHIDQAKAELEGVTLEKGVGFSGLTLFAPPSHNECRLGEPKFHRASLWDASETL